MLDFIHTILGYYHPLDGTGLGTVDWAYVIAGLSWLILFYSFFRIIGIFLGGRR